MFGPPLASQVGARDAHSIVRRTKAAPVRLRAWWMTGLGLLAITACSPSAAPSDAGIVRNGEAGAAGESSAGVGGKAAAGTSAEADAGVDASVSLGGMGGNAAEAEDGGEAEPADAGMPYDAQIYDWR